MGFAYLVCALTSISTLGLGIICQYTLRKGFSYISLIKK
jgi:hypothetical protein